MKYLKAFLDSLPAKDCPVDGSGFRWTRLGSLPRRGWELEWVEDLEEPAHECEACGYSEVRYVHHCLQCASDLVAWMTNAPADAELTTTDQLTTFRSQ